MNLPETATVDDIADAYIQAWRLGIKALAVYRDGCKTAQALSTDAHKRKDAPATAAGVARAAAGSGTETGSAEAGIEIVQATAVVDVEKAIAEALAKAPPKRHRMPRERRSITHKFSLGGHEGYITAGMYEDGTVGEIFLTDIGKEGSTLRGMMNAFATAISIALQYGVPLETLVRKFSYMRFEPEGMTSNPEIPFAKSMPDYIMRWLASRFLDVDLQEELGILTPEVRARKAAQDAAISHRSDTAVVSRSTGNGAEHGGDDAAGGDGADRLPTRAARRAQGPRPRTRLPAVRRHDAAHRQLLHVRKLRLQHRLRIGLMFDRVPVDTRGGGRHALRR